MLENELDRGTEGALKRWLEDVGLGHYNDLFVQHRLDLDVMGDLTEADLAELGLPLGDRKRLQRAMTALFQAETAEKPGAAAGPQARPKSAPSGASSPPCSATWWIPPRSLPSSIRKTCAI